MLSGMFTCIWNQMKFDIDALICSLFEVIVVNSLFSPFLLEIRLYMGVSLRKKEREGFITVHQGCLSLYNDHVLVYHQPQEYVYCC